MNLSFRQFVENEYSSAFKLLEIRGDSSGSYGWGGGDEVPARDPRISPLIEINITHQHEPYLEGLKVYFIDEGEGGSYHERWWNGYAYVQIPDEVIESWDAPSLNFFNKDASPERRRRKKDLVGTSVFKNIDDLLRYAINYFDLTGPYQFTHSHNFDAKQAPDYWKKLAAKQYHDDLPKLNQPKRKNVPKPGESSEEYWKRLVDKTWSPKPKDQWEGD
ncbi:MAG: hypothetical protein DWQ19_11230 [Crenarchaeota archaeon]|nr:MAG: hypothetical protein DWQ19_11230 [Thermoproteota archaeon]